MYKTIVYILLLLLSAGVLAKSRVEVDGRLNRPLQVTSIIVQDEIDAQIIPTRNAGAVGGYFLFGIFGAAAGASVDVTKDRYKLEVADVRLTPHRDMLKGYDFTTQLHAALKEALNTGNIELLDYIVSSDEKDFYIESRKLPRATKDRDLLNLSTRYSFDPHFETLHVVTVGNFYRLSKKKKDIPVTRQSFAFIYQSPARTVKYKEVDEDLFQRETGLLNKDYEKFMAEAKTSRQRSQYRRILKEKKAVLQKKLKAYRTRNEVQYVYSREPISQGEWAEDEIKQYLARALKHISGSIVSALQNPIRKKVFKRNSVKMGFLTPNETSTVLRDVAGYELYDDGDYKLIYFRKFRQYLNAYYLAPSREIVQKPIWYSNRDFLIEKEKRKGKKQWTTKAGLKNFEGDF